MPPGKQAKEVKIEFKMEVNKMVSAMEQVQKSFKESTQNIDKMSDSFKNMETKLHLVNMKMADMAKNISAMTQTNMIMSKDIKESFATWGTLLNDNNQKITSAITKMIQLNKQNQAQREELAKQRAETDKGNKSLENTFVRLKTLNALWNAIRHTIENTVKELLQFDRRTNLIASISGEKLADVQTKIFKLSAMSGVSINEMAKAIQDSANEGNNLERAFQKIQAAAILSQKSMGSLENSIARIDDIVDQFGVSAEKALGIVLGKNLSSERSLAVFGRLARDAKEAGLEVDTFSSILNVMANKAGIAERSLQIGFRAILNGLQEVGAEGQKIFFEQIMPGWNSLDEQTKRLVERQLGLRQNDEFLRQMGERWGEIGKDIKYANDNQQDFINKAKELPEPIVNKLNNIWNAMALGILNAADKFNEKMPIFMRGLNALNEISKFLTSGELTSATYIQMSSRLQTEIDALLKEESRLTTLIRNDNDAAGVQAVTLKRVEAQERLNKLTAMWNSQMVQGRIDFAEVTQSVKDASSFIDRLTTKKGTYSPDMSLFSNVKDSDKEYKRLETIADENIKQQYDLVYVRENKLAALKTQISAINAEIAVTNARLAREKLFRQDDAYVTHFYTRLAHLKTQYDDVLRKIKDETGGTDNRTRSSETRSKNKELTEHMKDLRDRKIATDLAYKQGEESYSVHLQKLIQIRAEAKKVEGKSGTSFQSQVSKDILNDQKQLLDAAEKVDAIFNKTGQKDKLKDLKEEMETRKLLYKLNNDHNMSRKEQLKLLDDEYQYARRVAQQEGVVEEINGRRLTYQEQLQNVQMEYHNTVAALRQRDIDLINQKMIVDVNATQQEIANAEAVKQKKINAIQNVINKDAEYTQKKNENSINDQRIADAFANGLNTVMNTALEKAIKNTGDLSHAWSNFAKDFLLQIAQMIAKQMVFNALTGMGLTSGKGVVATALKKVFGFSSGTGVGGVPGYASGTGMMGTDTVPAMLTPGEIVLDRNASDVFRGMAASGGGMGGITVIIQSNPSLLGNREELIRLDTALNNPIVRTSSDRRRI